ncbi:flagellar assembly protein FliW [Exiguobacterium sp. KRL4]|uniref:Flagellar assembly factor FliW n=1 Tax=Exiguobacterium antarcticum TaxID=132920 RepID=A0ABT6QY52_9BACL|nr:MULTISPECIES: flagellar assembly protein FliW [Exiguobacterium]MDI3233610.1 flagellar assembly protein FliW [Exiguobacterium antarcticum]OIN67171.1 flagellar assembly protein FliW [Exiguobacterium sp. KRL4]
MQINTDFFGTVQVEESEIITFASEVPGFPDARRFILLPFGEGIPFWSFQSIDQEECAFVVTNPFWIDPDYVFELPESAKEQLGIQETAQVAVYTTVTLREPFQESTTNLRAPFVMETKRRQAKQIILDETYANRRMIGSLTEVGGR